MIYGNINQIDNKMNTENMKETSLVEEIPMDILIQFTNIITKFSKEDITSTKPGSVNYLIYGTEKSRQSVSIKLGKIIGEEFIKMLIVKRFELLECGILCVSFDKKKKDFDLIWKDQEKKTIYYRESKGNMELDTEKLPATIKKVNQLKEELQIKYPEYIINYGLLNWSIYERTDAVGGLTQIKFCEMEGIKVDHFNDLLNILQYNWEKNDYTNYFRSLGKIIG